MTMLGDPTFRWLERGDGEPVLLLHGLMGEMDHWEALLLTLEDSCRPMALALPLFDPRLTGLSVPELAGYVGRFMDALDLPPAVVGGNSLGGHLALELALTRPERVSGLILTGSSGLFERGFSRGVPHRPTPAYVREKMEEVFYDRAHVTPEWVERVRGIVTTRELARRVLRVASAARSHNVDERLPAIQVPTLIIWGRDDRITPPGIGARFHARIPDSEFVVLPYCGHAPMLERPGLFAATVRAWLDATRAHRGRLAAAGGLR